MDDRLPKHSNDYNYKPLEVEETHKALPIILIKLFKKRFFWLTLQS